MPMIDANLKNSMVAMKISRNILLIISSCCFVCGTLVNSSASKNKNKATNWWNLANVAYSTPIYPADPFQLPPHIRPLTRKQQKIVDKNPGSFGIVVKAAKLAADECGRQLGQQRWNCPLSTSYHSGSIFGKITKKGCRETAFLHALTSAALTYSVAKACAEGTILTCSCGSTYPKKPNFDMITKQRWEREEFTEEGALRFSNDVQRPRKRSKKNERRIKKINKMTINVDGDDHTLLNQFSQNDNKVEWQWGGCSDNSEFGVQFSKEFIDGSERDRDMRCAVNLHNNQAGRNHVSRRMKPDCKCHGMSGSCSIKTCWMRLPSFSEVADLIKEKFDDANKVDQGNDIKGRTKFSLRSTGPTRKVPAKLDLVYFEESPLFCEPDMSLNFSGVKGRLCNASSQGEDGCDQMCCGRGHRVENYEMFEKCNCSFQWCCEVLCDKCHVEKERHICL